MREFCTYFDGGYLPRARVLQRSLLAVLPDARLFALCLDDTAFGLVTALDDPRFVAVSLSELEAADPDLMAAKPTRSLYEYYFTLGPSLLRYLLDREGVSHMTYLDADMRFYSDPTPLFEESEGASVVIVGHRFPERLRHFEVNGRFNVAWVGFADDERGRHCLDWWRERCLEWCYDIVEPDRFADQKYLDRFPELIDGVHVLAHPGADVAPWNLDAPAIRQRQGRLLAGTDPVIFFHFQGLKRLNRWVLDPNLAVYGSRATRTVRRMYRAYASEIEQATPTFTSPRRAVPHDSRVRRAAHVARGLLQRTLIACR